MRHRATCNAQNLSTQRVFQRRAPPRKAKNRRELPQETPASGDRPAGWPRCAGQSVTVFALHTRAMRQINHSALLMVRAPNCAAASSSYPQMCRRDRDAGLRSHQTHQHPDTLVGGNAFNRRHKIGEGAFGQRHLIPGLQHFWRPQFALSITAQHQLVDQISRCGCRHITKADQPRDPIGRIHRTVAAVQPVKSHKQVTGKERAHLHHKHAAGAFRFFLHRQKNPKSLPREIARGNMVAVGFILRQKPIGVACIEIHSASKIYARSMRSNSRAIKL